jgi:ABC-type dipeptide/oligopeptide/nickel transport system permease subunit
MYPVTRAADAADLGLDLDPDDVDGEQPRAWRRRHHGQFYAGAAIIVVIVAVSLLAPVISPDSPLAQNFAERFAPPFTDGHLLGTDSQGRDVLSRLIWGGRTSLLVAFLATTAAAIAGATLGLLAAFSRDWLSALIMRTTDLLLAFPVVMVALSLAEIIGPGVWVIGVSVAFAAVPYITRISYGEARRERGKEYVEAARALGAGRWSVMLREVAPNISTSMLVYWSSMIGINMVLGAGLSAIGVGVQPPTADWGQMLADGAQVLLSGSPWEAIIPGLALLVVGVAFNWLGDGLRDILDPHSSTAR